MKEIKDDVLKEVQEHILPFWIRLKDEKYGGFCGAVNFNLVENRFEDKGGIAAARILWTFSSAYRVLGNDKYLECATHAYRFLREKVIDDEYKGLYWMLDYKGEPKDVRKHVYTQSFGIYALSEYYRVTNDYEALEIAKELFYLIENKGFNKENGAYLEEFTREWDMAPNEMLSENGIIASITTNTHLHVLESYTNLYRVWKDELLKDRLTYLVQVFYEKIFNKESRFLKVFFDEKWKEIIDLKSYGHDIEASWLLDDALKVLGLDSEELNEMVVRIAYNIADKAILEDGSMKNEKEGYKDDLTRVWWVQAEAMVGFLNAFERTKDIKFIDILKRVWNFTKENIIDKRDYGEWYWSLDESKKPIIRDIAEPWKTPYHNTRFCLELIERIGE